MINRNLLAFIHFFSFFIFLIGCFFCFIFGYDKWILPFLTVPMLNIVLIPYSFYNSIRKDFFNPFLGVLVSLTIGTILRSFFIISPLESPTKHYMLMGKSPDILILGIVHIYLGLIFLILGFIVAGSKIISLPDIFKSNLAINQNKLIYISYFIIILGIFSIFLYLRALGLNFVTLIFSDSISEKRFMQLEDGGYTSLAYFRKIVDLVKFVFFILCIYIISNRFFSKKFLIYSLTVLTGLISIFFNFINSNRGQAGWTILIVFVIIYYIKGKISKKILVPGVIIVISLLMTMTFLRRVSSKNENVEIENPLTIVVGSLNFLGIGKASYIASSIPEKMEFQYGRTLVLWMAAPIPRVIWPGKPEISIGKVIALEIYEKIDENSKAGGVPPGFITELYMNFGIPGIVIGMFFLGYFIKILYNSLVSVRSNNAFALLIYILILRGVLGNLLAGDLSRIVVDILSTLIPLFIIFKFIKK